MMPAANRPLVCGYFRLLRAASNRGETDKLLMTLPKTPAVSLFHRFWGTLPRNFTGGQPAIKIPEALFPKAVKRRNRQRFITKYQLVVCFSRFETE
jgi:hypothetical protein